MKSITRIAATIALLLLAAATCLAGSPEEDCMDVLGRNFAAMREGDTAALVATCSPAAPRQAVLTFAREAEELFSGTSVHVSLADWQWLGQQGAFSAARVRQHTHTDGQTTEYRQASRLLPAHSDVEYIQIFHRYGGRWFIWTSKDEKPAGSAAGCPDGKCSLVNRTRAGSR